VYIKKIADFFSESLPGDTTGESNGDTMVEILQSQFANKIPVYNE